MAKTPTIWIPPGSGTVIAANANVKRVLQDGTLRIEQDNTQRILQENIVFGKIPTTWIEGE